MGQALAAGPTSIILQGYFPINGGNRKYVKFSLSQFFIDLQKNKIKFLINKNLSDKFSLQFYLLIINTQCDTFWKLCGKYFSGAFSIPITIVGALIFCFPIYIPWVLFLSSSIIPFTGRFKQYVPPKTAHNLDKN